MRPINADPIANGIALYMAENAYLNDTPLDVLKTVADWVNEAPTVDAMSLLPCKIGDTVWGIKKYNHGREAKQGVVHQMFFGDDMRLCICVKNVCRGEWGQNVFATKEEAEEVISKTWSKSDGQ